MHSRRVAMVKRQLEARGIRDPAVLAAFARVPREDFVAPADREHAYDDTPLPIGHGATISQPYVVALALEALALDRDARVLDIGTGSGYAAALAACIAREVHTVERVDELARGARDRLAKLGYANVHVHTADGSLGWPSAAPYDAIAVSAGAPKPPPALLEQLAIGGRLVVPSGPHDAQHLLRITRVDREHYDERDLGPVRFVALVGEQGWPGVSSTPPKPASRE
jgi:protein-L-isoaspartate(D-aspartate) O-methyltransferase